MSFLNADRFAGKRGDGLPKQVRTSRALLWVQGVLGLLATAFVLVTTVQIQGLSESELAKQSGGQLTHDLVPYLTIYGFAAALALLSMTFIWCAIGLKAGRKLARFIAFIAEGLLIPVSAFNMAIYVTLEVACVFILPGIAVVVLLSSAPAKEWFTAKPVPD